MSNLCFPAKLSIGLTGQQGGSQGEFLGSSLAPWDLAQARLA